MKQDVTENREGFWKTDESDSRLPLPIPHDKPWKGQKDFLAALDNMEMQIGSTYAAQVSPKPTHRTYRGFSRCRICGKANGTGEFSFGGWVWPDGLKHYVETHNVRPSVAFQEFVLGRELQ